jgi:hypothetical protein
MSFLHWKPQHSVAVEYQEWLTNFVERVALPDSSKQRPVSLDARCHRYDTIARVSWTYLLATVQGCSIWRRSPPGDHESCRRTNQSAEHSGDVGGG